MSFDDTSSVSESSLRFRKEDTFVVTDKESTASPTCEDIRRRKAIALAKANARHAVKMDPGQNNFHRHSKPHRNFTNQGSSRYSQHDHRAYIESTGSELHNSRGEKICFQWKTSDPSSRQPGMRVVPSLRKLYEYKKQKLKYKSFENRKSAPNKKSTSNQFVSRTDVSLKRSKTSDTTPDDHESSFVLSASKRLTGKVAPVVNDKAFSENKGTRSEYFHTTARDSCRDKKLYPLTVIPETSKDTLRKETSQTHLKSLRSIKNTLTKEVNLSDLISPTDVSQRLDILARLSAVAPALPLMNDVKDLTKVPCKSSNKIFNEPKVKNRVNDVQNSTQSPRDIHGVSKTNPFRKTHEKITVRPETNSRIECESENINMIPAASSEELQSRKGAIPPTESSRKVLLEKSPRNHDSTRIERMDSDFIRHTRTEPDSHGNNSLVTDSTINGHQLGRDNFEHVSDRLLDRQESSRNEDTPVDKPATRDNISIRNKHEHTLYFINDAQVRQPQRTFTGIAETKMIAKSDVDFEQKNAKAVQYVGVTNGSINEIDTIDPKVYLCDHSRSYSNEKIKDVYSCGSSNDQNIALSVSRGLKVIETPTKPPRESKNKKMHTTSPVYVSEQVNRKENGISGHFKEACVKTTLKAKTALQGHGSKLSVHKQSRTTSKLAGGDGSHVVTSDQTDMAATVSKPRIDHRCVNKFSDKGEGLGTLQFEHTLAVQGSQSCVTELNRATAVAASHALETPQQDAEVSMATSQDNKNVTTDGQRRKPGLDMNDSLLLVAASVNNQRPRCNETCQTNIKHNDILHNSSNAEKYFPLGKEHFSVTLPVQSPSDLNAVDLVITDKHCHNSNPACQSIVDGSANDTLNSDAFDFQEGDETKSTILFINRFKNASNLALGELHLSDGVEKKDSAVTNDVPCRKSKTPSCPMNSIKKPDLGSSQETKENIQHTKKSNGNRLQINENTSANSVPTLEERRVHCGTCEEESIADHKSISEGKLIHNDLHAIAISATVARQCETQAGKGDDQITVAAITCGNLNRSNEHLSDLSVTETLQKSVNNDITDNIRQLKDTVLTHVCDVGKTVIGKVPVKLHTDKDTNQISDCRKKTATDDDNDLFHTSKTRKSKELKRQTLSLHTQKMEFRDLPKKPTTKTNMVQQTHSKLNNALDITSFKTGSVMASHKNAALQNIPEDVGGQKGPVSNTETDVHDSSRPKTAGLSAYAPGSKNEDLWSVNTGDGDDDDDDDEDDRIQFIDGEQDFYEVFGYNEETAAILKSTKVYPVQHSLPAVVTSVEPSEFSRQRTNELHANSCIATDRSIGGSTVFESIIENSKTLTKRNKKNEDFYFPGTDTLLKQTDHSKLSKSNSILVVQADKSFPKHVFKDHKTPLTGNQGYANIHRKLNNNHMESTASCAPESHQAVKNPTFVESRLAKDYSKIEPSLNERKQETFLPSRNNTNALTFKTRERELREIKKPATYLGSQNIQTFSNANLASVDPSHISGTLTSDHHILNANQKKGRRRIHSDADIPITSNDLPDCHAETNITNQNEQALSSREVSNQNSKDSKSHVALRNQLATEKHINHTRSYRYINNGFIPLHKNPALHTSNDKITSSRPKDFTHNRQGISNDTSKPLHSRSKENTSYLEQPTSNPYLNAADRIMSRITDTENLICSRSDVYNGTVSQDRFQDRTAGTYELNSPLRRMSHPVDARIKNTSGSYFVARPRKLQPILQQPELNQDSH